jgi:DNA replication protein DnaC
MNSEMAFPSPAHAPAGAPPSSHSASLDQKLTTLRLARIREVYASWADQAAQEHLSYVAFLDELVTEELLGRQEHRLQRHLRQAGFPFPATMEQFDFTLRPELKRTVILRYFDSSFVTGAGSLLLIGASGLGKTHLAIAVGTKMVQLGYRVRFTTAQQLANTVLAASSRPEVARLVQPLLACDLLILDEFGYLPLDPQVGPVLYEVLAGRYEKGATILTSNKRLASWGDVVGETAPWWTACSTTGRSSTCAARRTACVARNRWPSPPDPRAEYAPPPLPFRRMCRRKSASRLSRNPVGFYRGILSA